MAGVNDNIAFFGDWASPSPSSRTFLASFIGSNLLSGNGNEAPSVEREKEKSSADYSMVKDEDFAFETLKEPSADQSNALSIPKPRSGGGLSERVAAKAGFSALKINISRAETVNLSSNTDASSPFVTIPPGLSPTTLLDSPVFLFNNLVQPSPTTGKFPLSTNPCSVPSEGARGDKLAARVDTSRDSLAFKPHVETTDNNKMVSTVENQSHLIAREVSAQPGYLSQSGRSLASKGDTQKQQTVITESSGGKGSFGDYQVNQRAPNPAIGNDSHHSEELDDKEPKGDFSAASLEQQSDDGYNWRKYGQKQVKGSEHPRSYYKCTYPNCEVKKKVERSPEGRVIEIIYKGKHIHPKPAPNRRTSPLPLNAFSETKVNGSETFEQQLIPEIKPMWGNRQNEAASYDRRNDGMDASSSISLAAELRNPSVNTCEDPQFEPVDAVDVSSTMSNEGDEQTTHQSAGLSADGDDDESESKRRKLDNCTMDVNAASRAVNREPRVVVQTTSEVDILDDGYRWRKYGQKVVKGNPNPRSYYKCTSPGCPVRKHVERASHDLKSVITTYEGKHNHEVPAARNSGHSNSNCSGMGASTISQSQSIGKRPEPTHITDGYSHFTIPSNVGSFGMHRAEQPGPPSGFSLGLGQRGLASLSMARYGPAIQGQAMLPLHSYFGPHSASEAGMAIPKGEPKEEIGSESGIQISNNALVYQQLMGGLTMGPQM